MAATAKQDNNTARLKHLFTAELASKLQSDLKLDNPHQVPRLEKIVLNIGLGRNKEDKRFFETTKTTLRKITGQEPQETFAHKSIAGFKLREGQRIGLKVTLRGEKMYEFLDRVITIVLPRLRDFHGVSVRAFDGQANYSIGIKDQSVFPELSFEDMPVTHGLQITIVTSTDNKQGAYELLKGLGMPFEKKELS